MPTEIHYGEPKGDRQSQLSYGERQVGLTFNPSGNPQVLEVKKLYASVIDALIQFSDSSPTGSLEKTVEFQQAVIQAKTACMWAVKAITYPY